MNLASTRSLWLLAAVLAVAAFVLRLVAAADRPVHTDEAVNAVLLGDMLAGGTLRYDPQDRHGPALLFAAGPIVRACGVESLAGMQAWHLRVLPALAGAALLLVLPLFAGGLGRSSVAASFAWFLAGAPFVYYGGTFIHEVPFVLLSCALLACGWRWWCAPRRSWAVAAGATAGLLLATKEAAPVIILGAVLAAYASRATGGRDPADDADRGGAGEGGGRGRPWARDLTTALLVAVGLAALVYSSFGANPGGVVDAVRGWGSAAGRAAAGAGHEKPWFAYGAWLFAPGQRALPWFGWTLLVFGAIGAVRAFQRRRIEPLGWFLVLDTAVIAVVLSATPYKTPWLLLNCAAPAVLVAGLGCEALWSWSGPRWRPLAAAVPVMTVLGLLGVETVNLCVRFPVDPGNPLAYAPTVPDMEGLPALIERRLGPSAAEDEPLIMVIGDDYWPLPWYLRRFTRVGYWPEMPEDVQGEVVIATGTALATATGRFGSGWRADFVGLRPGVLALVFTRTEP